MKFYLYQNEATWGPYELAQVQELLQGGNITTEVLAAVEGSDQWAPLKELVNIEGAETALPRRLFTPAAWQVGPDNRELIKYARKRHASSYRILFVIAGLHLLLGLSSDFLNNESRAMFGSPSLTTGAGIIYLLLGVFVASRSTFALGIALAIFGFDTIVFLMLLVDSGFFAIFPLGILISIFPIGFRLTCLTWMSRGFDAISMLQKLDHR